VLLESFLARLRTAGVVELYLASEAPGGMLFEASTGESAKGGPARIVAKD